MPYQGLARRVYETISAVGRFIKRCEAPRFWSGLPSVSTKSGWDRLFQRYEEKEEQNMYLNALNDEKKELFLRK